MAHRRREVEGDRARERELCPALAFALPVQGRRPAVLLHGRPPVREPQLRPAVAAVLDEPEVVGGGNGMAGQRERLEPHAVARPLVVEREARSAVADLHQAAVMADPARGRGGGSTRVRGTVQVDRAHGVRPQRVLDVGEDQLLVLLLVMQAQLRPVQGVRVSVGRPGQEDVHALVDRVAVGAYLLQARTGQGAPLGPRRPRADRFVVRVEEVGVARVHRPVPGDEARQHEGLEEPGGVREVPLGRARLRHGLDELVLDGQGSGEGGRGRAHERVLPSQRRRAGDGPDVREVSHRLPSDRGEAAVVHQGFRLNDDRSRSSPSARCRPPRT